MSFTYSYRVAFLGNLNGNTYGNLGNWFQNRTKNDGANRNTLLAPSQLYRKKTRLSAGLVSSDLRLAVP